MNSKAIQNQVKTEPFQGESPARGCSPFQSCVSAHIVSACACVCLRSHAHVCICGHLGLFTCVHVPAHLECSGRRILKCVPFWNLISLGVDTACWHFLCPQIRISKGHAVKHELFPIFHSCHHHSHPAR